MDILSETGGKIANKKQAAFITLRRQGLTVADASEVVGYNLSYAYKVDKKSESFTINTPAMRKRALKAITETLDMKPVDREIYNSKTGEIITVKERPTITNRLQAAGMVVDRSEPIIRRNENLNVNADISPVDLSAYLRPKPEPGKQGP